jgi:hypothetical protein
MVCAAIDTSISSDATTQAPYRKHLVFCTPRSWDWHSTSQVCLHSPLDEMRVVGYAGVETVSGSCADEDVARAFSFGDGIGEIRTMHAPLALGKKVDNC